MTLGPHKTGGEFITSLEKWPAGVSLFEEVKRANAPVS